MSGELKLSEDFSDLVDAFIAAESTLQLSESAIFFENSIGNAIGETSSAINNYNNSMTRLANLYSATAAYLEKARNNLDDCELDNTVDDVEG